MTLFIADAYHRPRAFQDGNDVVGRFAAASVKDFHGCSFHGFLPFIITAFLLFCMSRGDEKIR